MLMAATFAPFVAWSQEAVAEVLDPHMSRLPSARHYAMGGYHAALSDDFESSMVNPAGFQQVQSVFSASRLGVRLSGDVFDLTGVAVQAASILAEEGSSIATVIGDPDVAALLRSIYAGVELSGPIVAGYAGAGIGFGFYNLTDVRIETVASATYRATLRERLILSGGYAFRVPFNEAQTRYLDGGVLLRGYVVGETALRASLLSIPDLVSGDPLATITGRPLDLTTGIGIDLGVIARPLSWLQVGLLGANLVGPGQITTYNSAQAFVQGTATTTGVRPSRLPLDLSLGVAFLPPIEVLDGLISDLIVLIDYRDILARWTHPADSDNPWLRLSAGAEVRLLEALAVRAGLDAGLFTTGFGLTFGPIILDIAIFGSELGTEPGMRSVYNLMVDLALEF